MKKILAVVLALAMLLACAPAAFAEIDLSALSFEELRDLREKVQLEMFARQEWQAVQVPQGLYLGGRDIPVGQWNVKALEGNRTTVKIGRTLDDGGMQLKYPYLLDQTVYDPKDRSYSPGDCSEYVITVTDGDYVEISRGSAIFETFTGLKLGFKF